MKRDLSSPESVYNNKSTSGTHSYATPTSSTTTGQLSTTSDSAYKPYIPASTAPASSFAPASTMIHPTPALPHSLASRIAETDKSWGTTTPSHQQYQPQPQYAPQHSPRHDTAPPQQQSFGGFVPTNQFAAFSSPTLPINTTVPAGLVPASSSSYISAASQAKRDTLIAIPPAYQGYTNNNSANNKNNYTCSNSGITSPPTQNYDPPAVVAPSTLTAEQKK